MSKLIILVSFCFVGMSFAMPASNEQLDKTRRSVGGYLIETGAGKISFNENLDTLHYDEENLIATVNDVAVNAVSEDKRPDLVLQQPQPQVPSTVQISGITTGVDPIPSNPAGPENNGGFKPQRAGSMFARLIDDIFQIPITVLQSVAKLITNPFTAAKKDVSLNAEVK